MRVLQLAFVLMIFIGASLQGKGAQQKGRLFAEGNDDSSLTSLSDEVRGKGWIIYSARTGKNDWDLFLMRPDGSDRRNITNTPEFNEAAARFSPDGQKILYYRMPKNVAMDNNKYGIYDLVIADAKGTNPVVWGNDYNWASWGPNGSPQDALRRKLACLSIKGVRIIDLSTKKAIKELSRRGIVQQLVWSPDGKWFIGTANGIPTGFVTIRFNGFNSNPTGSGNEIKNNIFYNCSNGSQHQNIYIAASSGFTDASFSFDANVYYNSTKAPYIYYNGTSYPAASWIAAKEPHGKTSTPTFVSYSPKNINNNLHLASTDNVAKDAGVSLGSYFTTDKDGITRPQGSAWNIGAYE